MQAQDKLDAADRHQFDEREAAKTQFAQFKKTLMGPLLKRLANHTDVVQQTREQAPFAAGAARS